MVQIMFYKNIKKSNVVTAIVDGYSIGGFFAPELSKLGHRCIHVQSSTEIPSIYKNKFASQDYEKNIIFTGHNLRSVVNQLKELGVKYIIAGAEPGVELADLLSEKLGLLTNGTKLSSARRNKFEMIEALKRHDLATAEHVKSRRVEDIIDWARKQTSWPIVLKPLKGAAAEKTFFCHSQEDITHFFGKILDTRDIFGNKNTEVLAESYLDGPFYQVNMVSVNGQHILSDLWILVKKRADGTNGTTLVSDYQQLLPSTHYLKEDLVKYTRKVLDALGIKHGASHNEVFVTKKGPTLVESGARIMGVINPHLIAECVGRSQLELTLASYIQPGRLNKPDLRDYNLRKYLWTKMLISNQSGIIKKIKFLDEIKSFPSFAGMSFNVEVGKPVVKTVDLVTIPGVVFLCHENEEVIKKDYSRITSIEKTMFET